MFAENRKTMKNSLKLLFVAFSAALSFQSCEYLMMDRKSSEGSLEISFSGNLDYLCKSGPGVPDTNSFILSITDEAGASVYTGSYGSAPQTILTPEGTYYVRVRSCEFSTPVFDSPQYGDDQVVAVRAGASTRVKLECAQTNCGIRLKIDPAFLTDYPGAVFYLKSADGKLMYGYSEKRFAYFNPGGISLMLTGNGSDKTLFTRRLEARDMLVLNVTSSASRVPGDAWDGLSVRVDTTRNWIEDNCSLGGGREGAGESMSDAYGVGDAKNRCGETDVWVHGYIVGGDLSSSKCSFDAPFSSRTNLVIATKSSCRDKQACMSVQLLKGDARDELNLVDHPENLGRQVYLKGDIVESYYGIPGIQSISEYVLK